MDPDHVYKMDALSPTQASRKTAYFADVPDTSLKSGSSSKAGLEQNPKISREANDACLGERGWGKEREETVVADMETMALKALHVDDDPSLSPWTFRMFFLGTVLAAFGSTLATIFMFKPQSVSVSVIFLTVLSYFFGLSLQIIIPREGWIGQWLNPFDFNSKEHLAIIIYSGTASGAAYATEVLATQKLYYNVVPNAAVAVFLLFSSQLLGYGMAGVLRKSLVYPTKMLWPSILPLSTLVETLHRDRSEMRKRFRFFWIIFGVIAVWELMPQYVMPILTGISVFCLSRRDSMVFTNVFGGAAGNEGLGLLSVCLDWQYVTTSSFFLPLITLTNGFFGWILGMALFLALYYGNVWSALKFPFLSQQLYAQSSNETHFEIFNQSAILDKSLVLDVASLEEAGLPYFSATNAAYLLTTNLGITATLTHIFLWNYDAVRDALDFGKPDLRLVWQYMKNRRLILSLARSGDHERAKDLSEEEKAKLDPHYRAMLEYDETPQSWYILVLLSSIVIGLVCIYLLESTLPWWGFFIAITLSFTFTLFFGAMSGLIGFQVPITSLIQLLGGYLHPGKPMANIFFVLFGANAQSQALGLVGNLKLGQYGKLSPKCTFTVSILGTLLGALINYILMNSITTNQREILLSIQGTNIWSGQVIQSFNSNAIAFGALSKYLFSPSSRYAWIVLVLPLGLLVPLPTYFLHRRYPQFHLDYLVTPVLCWYLGYLSVGINSSVTIFFALGFFVQFYLRKRHPRWFLKYNYLLAAAVSGGTELLIFVTTFAVQGGSGSAVPFPPYWGNNFQEGNVDYCMMNPALR